MSLCVSARVVAWKGAGLRTKPRKQRFLASAELESVVQEASGQEIQPCVGEHGGPDSEVLRYSGVWG